MYVKKEKEITDREYQRTLHPALKAQKTHISHNKDAVKQDKGNNWTEEG